MSKRKQERIAQYRELKSGGWELDDISSYIKPNSGSEQLSHLIAKTVAAKVLIDAGYTVASEVTNRGNDKEADILAYCHESRRPIVVELENNLGEDTKDRKLRHYHIQPVSEVYVINLDNWQNNDPEWLRGYISEVTGL